MILASTAVGATDLTKLNDQALAPVWQLNRTCSSSVIYSHRDQKTGKVETLILTAKHCIEGAEGTGHTVYQQAYQANRLVSEVAYKAKVKAKDYASDLALLVLVDEQTLIEKTVKLAAGDLAYIQGEDAVAVGYSKGLSRTATAGMLGPMESVPFPVAGKDSEYLRASPQIAGGNSGGALFHINAAGDYEQLAVATAVIPASDFMGYWTHFAEIDKFLRRVAPQMYPAAPAPGKVGSVASEGR
jgi:S1-C subfamily serine protease